LSYPVQYICCKVCGSDRPRFLGIRGNLEYAGAPALKPRQEHMVTNVVQCRVCGFVYTNPLILCDNQEAYSEHDKYKSSADNIDPQTLFSFTMDTIEKYTISGKVLLDVGCGKGEFLDIAKKRGWRVYGTEPFGNLADYASKKYNLNIKTVPLENAGFSDSFFDVVTLNMVLEHLDEPKHALIEINRILKNNGILFIEVPNMDSLILKLATIYFKLNKKDWSVHLSPLHHPFHRYGYGMLSLSRLLKICGFKIKKVVIKDSILRGIRHNPSVSRLERWLCRTVIKMAGILGEGDILTVVAVKEKEGICSQRL
jgi:2-polyprenyl-3-methyl-5-hydroxy-6-metoxy-1,4-benzoquinol methylase